MQVSTSTSIYLSIYDLYLYLYPYRHSKRLSYPDIWIGKYIDHVTTYYYHVTNAVFTRDISIVLRYILYCEMTFTSRKRVSCKHGIRLHLHQSKCFWIRDESETVCSSILFAIYTQHMNPESKLSGFVIRISRL